MDISKFKIKEMSIDDIDSCLDIVNHKLQDDGVVFYNINKARTAWLRKGIDGITDADIKKLTDEEKNDLVAKIKEAQNLGE